AQGTQEIVSRRPGRGNRRCCNGPTPWDGGGPCKVMVTPLDWCCVSTGTACAIAARRCRAPCDPAAFHAILDLQMRVDQHSETAGITGLFLPLVRLCYRGPICADCSGPFRNTTYWEAAPMNDAANEPRYPLAEVAKWVFPSHGGRSTHASTIFRW